MVELKRFNHVKSLYKLLNDGESFVKTDAEIIGDYHYGVGVRVYKTGGELFIGCFIIGNGDSRVYTLNYNRFSNRVSGDVRMPEECVQILDNLYFTRKRQWMEKKRGMP